MANWSILKNAIASVIKTNGNQEITGQILQNTLNSIVNAVGENATFAGIATPSTNPGTPDGPVFYIASEPGTYANFNGLTIEKGETVILFKKNGWQKSIISQLVTTNIYVKYMQADLVADSVGTDGDVFLLNKRGTYRVYVKKNGVWSRQKPEKLSLSNVYRYGNSLFIKESVEDTGQFIEVAKDFATDIQKNFKVSSFYNLFVLNNRQPFASKKEARAYWRTNIAEAIFQERVYHGSIIYYEVSDGSKVLEQFIGDTGSTYFSNDTEWATIWTNVPAFEHSDFTENNSQTNAFIENRFLTIGKATDSLLSTSDYEKPKQFERFERNIAASSDYRYLCFAPILYTELEKQTIYLQVYNRTDRVYEYNVSVRLTNKRSQYFVYQQLTPNKEYTFFIGKPASGGAAFYMKGPAYYYIGDIPTFMLFSHDIDADLSAIEERNVQLNHLFSDEFIRKSYNIKTPTATFAETAIESGVAYKVWIKAPVTCNFRIYGAHLVNGVLKYNEVYSKQVDLTSGFETVISLPEEYTRLQFRTGIAGTVEELFVSKKTINVEQKESGQWSNMVYSCYGDSITAISNGDFNAPFIISNKSSWGEMVADTLGFSTLYGRGIGGQSFRWRTAGGSVCFAEANGVVNKRNDTYNYDNYAGNIEVPAGTTPIRGVSCSWLRITKQYPETIKDKIDVVTIMVHNDYTQQYNPDTEEVTFISNNETDPEWKASSYYATYNGDYNISSVKGAIASTIMKMQAWMPNAILVLCTPMSGRPDASLSGDEIDPTLKSNMISVAKAVKEVANLMSIPCIDVYGTDGINLLNRNRFISDIIHPYKLAGKKMLARTIIGGLKGIMPNIYKDIE